MKEAAKSAIMNMMKTEQADPAVVEILTKIHAEIIRGNEFASRTATNTKCLRQDVSGIRQGRTGPDARTRTDPLARAERRQVELVKKRYYELRKDNPHCSLFAISKAIRRADKAAGIVGGYKTDNALNSRASKEIKREDAGIPIF